MAVGFEYGFAPNWSVLNTTTCSWAMPTIRSRSSIRLLPVCSIGSARTSTWSPCASTTASVATLHRLRRATDWLSLCGKHQPRHLSAADCYLQRSVGGIGPRSLPMPPWLRFLDHFRMRLPKKPRSSVRVFRQAREIGSGSTSRRNFSECWWAAKRQPIWSLTTCCDHRDGTQLTLSEAPGCRLVP